MPCSIPNCPRDPFTGGHICPTHWQRLPRRIRSRLCELWRQGLGAGQEYTRLFGEAIRWTVEKEVAP